MKEPTYEVRYMGSGVYLVNFPFLVSNPHRPVLEQASRDNIDTLRTDPTARGTFSAGFGGMVVAAFDRFPKLKGLEIGADAMEIIPDAPESDGHAIAQEVANFFAAAGDSVKYVDA